MLVLLMVAVVVPVIGATVKKQPAAKAPSIDPQAEQLVKQMSDYLTGLDRFKVHVDSINEIVLPSGQRLDTDRASNVSVERPDKLRVDIASATKDAQVYYNGKTLTIYSPKKNYYGDWPAPPTIEGTIEKAQQQYGLVMPLADLLYPNPYQRMMKNVVSGTYVGKTLIHGTDTDHLAFRQKDIDWQIWIMSGDQPLPVRIIITDKSVKGSPQYYAALSNWDTAPTFQDNLFSFVPPPGAQKIRIATIPVPKSIGAGVGAGKTKKK